MSCSRTLEMRQLEAMADSHANENTCVVCFKNVIYYSIGECDHPVCFECSTRMRVLCLQNECPICRKDLSRVVFSEAVLPYKELRNKVFTDRLFERQFKIGFCTEEIKQAYDYLLENRCKACDKITPFRTFSMLSDHMRKVHERYFCDLCVKHLKIFTGERKCYTRQELAHHRRKGDLDDTSHRGHPLCEFCEERFMDADELYRHMRKEHLYCHLCDADGRNLYYSSHSELAHHFRTDHYLCEEGECDGQHLTAVFRSDIDLKAHKATVHGRGMNRGAARQARTLELQFNITPHAVAQRAPRERAEPPPSPPPTPPPAPRIDTRSDEHFPRLSAAPPAPSLVLSASNRTYRGSEGLARTDRNFPALDGAGSSRAPHPRAPAPAHTPATVAATIVRNSKPSVSIQLHSQPASASNFRLTQPTGNRISIPPHQKKQPLSDDDFPSLGIARDDHPSIGAATIQPPKVTLINSQEMQALKGNHSHGQHKKKQLSSEAFPALSASSAPSSPPQWITVSKAKEAKQKPSKPEPPPQARELAFNPVADFPTLPFNSRPKPKKTQPHSVPPQTENKPTKKEKKKQNSKKENVAEIPLVNGLDKKYAKDPSFTDVTVNNNVADDRDKKIKTVDTSPGADVTPDRNRNGGNGDFALAAKDYPPLNSRNDNRDYPPLNSRNDNRDYSMSNSRNDNRDYSMSNSRNDNKDYSMLSKKGQGSLSSKKMANGSVPPGFKPRPACDGMTFTNSAGQTFPAPVHSYIPPPDFELRNRTLVQKFAVALGGAAAVEDFKVASRAFRDNIINAEEFYQHCQSALGSQFESVFPDLVALLPDIAKQQELVVGKNITQLEVCSTCGQLLAVGDRIAHDTAHWPPLAPR